MRLLLLIVCLYTSLALSAQKTRFTDTTNIWKCMQPQYNAPLPWLFLYTTHSFLDTIVISSTLYRKFTFGAVREDTALGKVYLRSPVGDSDIILMDYNLKVGDTFYTSYYKFAVLGIDSTLINGVWHKVWRFPPIPKGGIYGNSDLLAIEGLGCIAHPTYMLGNFSGCVECARPSMYCFSSNGTTPALSPPVLFLDNTTSCVYYPTLHIDSVILSKSETTIYPTPAYDVINIATNNTVNEITLTDILGRQICTHKYNTSHMQINISSLPSGIYFIRINNTDIRKLVKNP
jgi:hypothetical protein